MYCKKCGKFIEGEGDLCESCRQAPTYAQATVIPPEPVNNGFKKALASTIVSACAVISVIIGYVLCSVSTIGHAAMEGGMSAATNFSTALGVFFMLAAVVGGILSLIWGIQSIKKFVELKRGGYKKPIATLVLGINGTAVAGFALFYALLISIILFCINFAVGLAIHF